MNVFNTFQKSQVFSIAFQLLFIYFFIQKKFKNDGMKVSVVIMMK